MNAPARSELSESQIRNLIDARAAAVRSRDVRAAVAPFINDVVQFDVVGKLETLGAAGCAERTKQWFSSFAGPIEFDSEHVRVEASGDIGFSHCLNHVRATQTHGAKLDMWWRSTTCYRRIDGAWRIEHEHNSIPFDPQTGKASLDLAP